jgi:hypothetical protein
LSRGDLEEVVWHPLEEMLGVLDASGLSRRGGRPEGSERSRNVGVCSVIRHWLSMPKYHP